MNSVSLPPFITDLGGQQPVSFLQGSFVIGKSVKGFQAPLVSLELEDVTDAVKRLKETVAAAQAEYLQGTPSITSGNN